MTSKDYSAYTALFFTKDCAVFSMQFVTRDDDGYPDKIDMADMPGDHESLGVYERVDHLFPYHTEHPVYQEIYWDPRGKGPRVQTREEVIQQVNSLLEGDTVLLKHWKAALDWTAMRSTGREGVRPMPDAD